MKMSAWMDLKNRKKTVSASHLPVQVKSSFHYNLQIRVVYRNGKLWLLPYCKLWQVRKSIKTAAAGSADKKMTAKAMLFSEAIVRGSDITKAAALASPLFSSLTIEFLIVGESSGALATMLKEAALLLEQDFTASLKNFKVLLEPVLLIIISLVIGAMIFTVASPLLTFLTEIPEYE